MPSLYESSGMTVLEAMACKTPCLVSDIDSLREITEGVAEFVNPFDIRGFSSKLASLLDDEKRKLDLAEKGYEVAQKYSSARDFLFLGRKI